MENIGKIALALAKAQAKIEGAKKDTENPFYKSKYADLSSVWDACRSALSENELSVSQPTDIMDGQIIVRTILMHSSGESITGILPVMVGEKCTAQQLGSAITYNRRYALAAIVGVAPEEDDGNVASETHGKAVYKKIPPAQAKEAVKPIEERAKDYLLAIETSETLEELLSRVNLGTTLMTQLSAAMPKKFTEISARIAEQKEALS